MAGSLGYRVLVRVRGQLSPAWWRDRFSGLTVVVEPGGTTLLCGVLPDQSAVHGLMATIRDLGLTLVSVETTATPRSPGADGVEAHDDAPRGRGGSR